MPEKSKVKCKIQKQKNKEKSRENILKEWRGEEPAAANAKLFD